jgi:heme oxygenase
MRLVDRLGRETEAFHDVTDQEVLRQLGPVTAEGYHRYLLQMYGFICPLERSIANTPEIEQYVDLRRFQKHELLRRDLSAFHTSSDEIRRVPQCAVPWFKTPEEALGWAYPIERSTLRHGDLFRHLARAIPGEVAFASSYLKCYLGAAGETWRSFGCALDAFSGDPRRVQQVIGAAKAAFHCLRAWRFLHDESKSVVRFVHVAQRRFAPRAPQVARQLRPASELELERGALPRRGGRS